MSSITALPTPTSPNKSALLHDSNVGKVFLKTVQSQSTRGSKRPLKEALAIDTPLYSCKPAVDCKSWKRSSLDGSSLDNEIANMPTAEDYHCDLLNEEPPRKVSASFSALIPQGISKSMLNQAMTKQKSFLL